MKYKVQHDGSGKGGDAWRRAVSETYFPLDVEIRNSAAFQGTLEAWSLGDVAISRNACDGLLYRRHRRHFLHESDSSLLITIPEIAEVGFSQGSRSTHCRPGGFLVERGDAPYEFWHGKTNSLWVLKVKASSVRSRIGPTDRIAALNFDATSGVASYFVDMVRTTGAHVDHLSPTARAAAGMHLLELLCLAIRSDDRVLDSNVSSIRAAHLHRAEQYIRDNLKDPELGPAQVAEACGISLRYLQRLFAEREQSINGFIRDKRLNRCAEELRAGGRAASVAEIAYRWGFSDQSRFSRLYKSRFGCTPTDTRRAAAAERASALVAPQ
ncbi:helix-turn-helix domain-containing protein [Albimonas sp. CAU 1670]|uniref:helix-turn-helix domain-containing protein n=1 Tax=Albimonas sp. CAU 1670 TaxID=3032599 RepID=UPI0023DC3329|nr:helix-turn-helix domain-containing protein [Albimonas sp. CAU 1670]MDF2230978.1 helix-turn-helix domain-containing protein [Albimonas sp. CAU 1670]